MQTIYLEPSLTELNRTQSQEIKQRNTALEIGDTRTLDDIQDQNKVSKAELFNSSTSKMYLPSLSLIEVDKVGYNFKHLLLGKTSPFIDSKFQNSMLIYFDSGVQLI